VFRSAFVFADSQTEPLPGAQPAPIEPPCEPLTGDSHAHLIGRLQAFAAEIDVAVAFEHVPGSADGWCDPKSRRIVVDAGLPANAQVRVLIHELTHALGFGYEGFGRARAEVIVDTSSPRAARATPRSATFAGRTSTSRTARSMWLARRPAAGFERST
jgi:hypothetical protein